VVSIEKLPPLQTTVIPGFEGKTPVAQMHFALELPLCFSQFTKLKLLAASFLELVRLLKIFGIFLT
jgi:hypothetical protein